MFEAKQSLPAQAELCVGRFDQRIRELMTALESVEALGQSAAQELEPLFEAKQSLQAQAELCASRFDQRIRELVTGLESVEALGQSAAQELEPLETLQQQMAGLAATLEPMKAFCGQLEQARLNR
jgi:chromosome segregation ATPase